MSRFTITANWSNNAPHLSPEVKRDLEASIPAYQKAARTEGIPQLGSGIVYAIPEEDILVDPFKIPDHWPRGYSLDVGWNRTSAHWRALDPDSEPRTSYLYDEHYRSEAQPEVHAAAIRRRGLWIPGRIDPAARGRNQKDGTKLLTLYRKAIYGEEDAAIGVRLLGPANNALESGIYMLLMAMQQGTFKVFKNRCPNFLAERRLYRRDEQGRIIKKFDHAMDDVRYNIASGDGWLVAKPATVDPETTYDRFSNGPRGDALSWMSN